MKERPIIFSAPMVRAILEGRKTQTRRAVKPQPIFGDVCGTFASWSFAKRKGTGRVLWPNGAEDVLALCPYGSPGDRLWVRETWTNQAAVAGAPDRRVIYRADNEVDLYRVNGDGVAVLDRRGGFASPWISSRFMPRWASRITLEVTGIRVERLQDITEPDAVAEGVEPIESEREDRDWSICPRCGGTLLYTAFHGETLGAMPDTDCYECDTAVKRYRHLWEHINGAGSWAASPWVWVVEFRRAA